MIHSEGEPQQVDASVVQYPVCWMCQYRDEEVVQDDYQMLWAARRQADVWRKKKSRPPWRKRIANFLVAMARVVEHTWTNWKLPLVGREVLEKRLYCCENCDARSGFSCTECGCMIPAKARLATEHCPRGIWEVMGEKTNRPDEWPDADDFEPFREDSPCIRPFSGTPPGPSTTTNQATIFRAENPKASGGGPDKQGGGRAPGPGAPPAQEVRGGP